MKSATTDRTSNDKFKKQVTYPEGIQSRILGQPN